jgi:hypothetical protein
VARARRLSTRKAAKAPKAKLTRVRRAGTQNVSKHLHGRVRARARGHGRARHPEWTPGLHPKPGARVKRTGLRVKVQVTRRVGGKRVVSPATRAKIAAALAGKKHPHKGHAVSANTRAKIAAALRGKHHPGKKGVRRKGHKLTAETRAKISKALKGRKHPHRGVPRRRKR